jgi:hypothetical protein
VHVKRLSTIVSLELAGVEALYALRGTLEYQIRRDRERLTIIRYGGSGVPLEEVSGATVEYRNDDEWIAEIGADRAFRANGTVVWTDRSTALSMRVPAAVLGTLLESNAIAYISAVIGGPTTGDRGLARGVSLQLPAVW